MAYWSETGGDRTDSATGRHLHGRTSLGQVARHGWFDWDIVVYCDSGLILKVVTVQEEHGQGKRLIRIRFQLCPTARLKVIGEVSMIAVAILAPGSTPGWR